VPVLAATLKVDADDTERHEGLLSLDDQAVVSIDDLA
jgi:hypothetical protein